MDKASGICALYWDESYLWGLMSYRSLRRLGLAFEIVSSTDIRAGALDDKAAIFVPGGWASNKIKALGEEGAQAVRDFVSGGGVYIGLCGGAGLATTAGGLGILNISRKPLKDRVPSLAGPVRLKVGDSSLLPEGAEPVFHIWWPSQFVLDDPSIKTLASFDMAMPDAFSSDINVGQVSHEGWGVLEDSYGINLDPERMKDDPVIVEGEFGRGKVLASLVHLDSPGSTNGAYMLESIWDRFALKRVRPREMDELLPSGRTNKLLSDLFDLGVRNFLWFRHGELLQWRRGVRGLEYFTLMELARELDVPEEEDDNQELYEAIKGFSIKASELLVLEAEAIRKGEKITFAKATDETMEALRLELFGKGKSHGGLYKEILGKLDVLLYGRLIRVHDEEKPAMGRVHVYTGDGKGKTTMGVGLALRAKSRGLRVLYAQFMKNTYGGEAELLRKEGIQVRRFREVLSPLFNPDEDMESLRMKAEGALKVLGGMLEDYDVVIADEFVTMVARGLVTEDVALGFINGRPEHVELALTGRGATEGLKEAADLVSEVRKVKHYADTGLSARKGIEY